MIVVYLSTSLALVYIMHQRPRITRVLAEYAGGRGVLVLIAKSCGIFLVCGHGGPRPNQQIGRLRGGYPLVQDTVT